MPKLAYNSRMSYQVRFCIVNPNQGTTEMLTAILLNMGIASRHVASPSDVQAVIAEKHHDFIFIDMDYPDNSSMELLKTLHRNMDSSSLFTIAYSFNTKPAFIKELQQFNLAAFFKKPLLRDSVKSRLAQLFEKFKDHFPGRKHVRIMPLADELMRISFTLPGGKRLSARVLDLSLGGLAAEFYSRITLPDLKAGSLMEHIVFDANHREIDVDAKIIKIENKFLAVKFTHFYHGSYMYLMKYIASKMSE
jgi:response regulator RpfG family c-di-GMP phosphodiesterase